MVPIAVSSTQAGTNSPLSLAYSILFHQSGVFIRSQEKRTEQNKQLTPFSIRPGFDLEPS